MPLYVVTGGAGFIGSHLTETLLAKGERVRVVDNLTTGHMRNVQRGVEFVQGDLADPEIAKRSIEGADYVLHLAGIPSVPRSVQDPVTSNRANIDATVNVLVAARDAKVKRLVYAASSSAYGNGAALPMREDMAMCPLSPYALQKLVGEEYLKLFASLYGLETASIRCFNVFGPRENPGSPYSGVISLFITALLQGRAPRIYGDGGQTRDFTYVSNVVDGVLRACTADGASGQVINVATGGRISVNELFATLQKAIGGSLAPEYLPARAGDVRDSQADIGKARAILGYIPMVGLEEGLRRTVDWYRAIPAAAARHFCDAVHAYDP